jgi:hypothetical protein
MRLFQLSPLLFALNAGCCHAQPPSATNPTPLIAVREEVSRSPTFALPLDEAARGSLLMFLAAGGSNDGIEDGALVTVVYPDAEQRWSKLLALLSDPANVDVADLSGPGYASWFKGPPIRQVVDAREPRPNVACPPFALTQERFVWIFKCKDGKTLGGVFVQQAIAERTQ